MSGLGPGKVIKQKRVVVGKGGGGGNLRVSCPAGGGAGKSGSCGVHRLMLAPMNKTDAFVFSVGGVR